MPTRPVEIFFSYRSRDRAALERILTQLSPLRQKRLIDPWYDGWIEPGDEWRRDVRKHLRSARIIVLLISAEYFASKECVEEMETALRRRAAEGTVVLPVILHFCLWEQTPLVDLEVLPVGGNPIDTWSPRSKGYANVAMGILKKVEKLYGLDDGHPPWPPGPAAPRTMSPRQRSAGPASSPRRTRLSELSRPFDNLPTPLNDFIGRKKELSEVVRRLHRKATRTLVLYGFGGIGKTRLALEAAARVRDRFRDGVCFVHVDQADGPETVMSSIAHTLGVRESETGPVAQTGGQKPVRNVLKEYLATKEMLLVLDGFEHRMAASAGLPELLNECPELKVFLTCRDAPEEDPELSYEVPTLPLGDAVELFARSAKARSGFALTADNRPLVEKICSRLDCIPLSIELAAAQSKLPLEEIIEEVDHRLLGIVAGDEKGGWDPSQEIAATIQWVYDRLDRTAKGLFHRLSVFSGSFTLEAATAVCGVDPFEKGLRALLASNIVRRVEEGRFRIFGMVAAYGRKRLRGRGKVFCHRHAEFYLSRAERAEPELTSPRRREWLELLEADHANLLAALHWCERQKGNDEEAARLGLRLAGALSWFWNLRAHFSEGRNRLEAALGGTFGQTPERAKALYGLGMLSFLQGDFETAVEKLQESSAIWELLPDRRRFAYAQIVLGMAASSLNRFPFARDCEERSRDIFQELGDNWWLALALNDLGNVYRAQGDYEQALEIYRQSLSLWEKIDDRWGLPLTLSNLGFLGMQKGDYEGSREFFQRALQVQEEVGDRWGRAETLKYLADLAVREIDYAGAARLYRESLILNREIGRNPFVIGCLAGIAVLAGELGESGNAARVVGFVNDHRGVPRVYAKSIDNAMYEKTVFAVYDLAWERGEGAGMSLDEATSFALRISTPWVENDGVPPLPKRGRMAIPLRPKSVPSRLLKKLGWAYGLSGSHGDSQEPSGEEEPSTARRSGVPEVVCRGIAGRVCAPPRPVTASPPTGSAFESD